MKANEFDQKFDSNDEDIIDDLDLSSVTRPYQSQKRINVDFPAWVIDSIDKEASRLPAIAGLLFRCYAFDDKVHKKCHLA